MGELLVRTRWGWAWGPWKSRGGVYNDLHHLFRPGEIPRSPEINRAVRNLWLGRGTESDARLARRYARREGFSP